MGLQHRKEVFDAFEYETRRPAAQQSQPRQQPQPAREHRPAMPPIHQPLPEYPSYSPPPSSHSPSPVPHAVPEEEDPESDLEHAFAAAYEVDSRVSDAELGRAGTAAAQGTSASRASGSMPGSMGLSRDGPVSPPRQLARSHETAASDSQLFPGSDLF
jgi:hypothetical protein